VRDGLLPGDGYIYDFWWILARVEMDFVRMVLLIRKNVELFGCLQITVFWCNLMIPKHGGMIIEKKPGMKNHPGFSNHHNTHHTS